MPPSKAPASSRRSASATPICVDDVAVDVEAGHVGEEDERPRAEPERERGGGVVGVHVQRPDGERRDDGHEPGTSSASRISRGAAGQRVADLAERRHRHGQQAVAVAEHRHGDVAERGAELGVDLGHRLAHDLERLERGAPPAADELDRDRAPLHLERDLRAGAVHDADLVAFLDEAEDPVGRLARDGAADLHDEAGDGRCEQGRRS